LLNREVRAAVQYLTLFLLLVEQVFLDKVFLAALVGKDSVDLAAAEQAALVVHHLLQLQVILQEVLVELDYQHLMATLEFLHLMELLGQLQEDGLQEEEVEVEVLDHHQDLQDLAVPVVAAAAVLDLQLQDLQDLLTLAVEEEELLPQDHLVVADWVAMVAQVL
jgi:hypothetical protein